MISYVNWLYPCVYVHMYILSVSGTYLQLYTKDHKATNNNDGSEVVSKFKPVDVCSE